MRVRDWATVDFYAVLGVEPTATADEVGLAFRTLAKQLHPDRLGLDPPGAAADSEQFKSVTAAYEVLGDERLRRSYDEVRIDTAVAHPAGSVTTIVRSPATSGANRGPRLSPAVARRRARRWIAAGIAVAIAGIFVAALVVYLQVDERARRAGRIKTEATVIVSSGRNELLFTTPGGTIVKVPEPERVNPGTVRDGDRITVLYRPDRPTDVLIDESTTARDITLWFVAVKLLVGGVVFLVVGIRRLRTAR